MKKHKPLYVLESFFYIKEWQIEFSKSIKMFLLDSGAFTFMNGRKGKVDFDEYLNSYISFINQYDIKYFFELDVDNILGYEKVKEMRQKLECQTKKKCIPVWHKSRGLAEWCRITKDYDYVAIGGFVTREIKKEEYKFIPKLLEIARKNRCKVHGLGFTNDESYKMDFYSVDSTNWLSASCFGNVVYFDGTKMRKYKTPKGKKATYYKIIDDFVVGEYVKFQKYLDKG